MLAPVPRGSPEPATVIDCTIDPAVVLALKAYCRTHSMYRHQVVSLAVLALVKRVAETGTWEAAPVHAVDATCPTCGQVVKAHTTAAARVAEVDGTPLRTRNRRERVTMHVSPDARAALDLLVSLYENRSRAVEAALVHYLPADTLPPYLRPAAKE